jgi:dimethylhistidine N-methyltransferase
LSSLDPSAVIPIDLSTSALDRAVAALSKQRPGLRVIPVVADFTEAFYLPGTPGGERRVLFFGGSTIGNFSPLEAVELLRLFARAVGPTGGILVGVDLPKDRITLERAYDDEEGVTAAFNLNLLLRINRELDGDFRIHQFAHLARWRPEQQRVEMHLVSTVRQRALVAERAFEFGQWETIHTESSHKYSISAFRALAQRADLRLDHAWTDSCGLYSVQYFVST